MIVEEKRSTIIDAYIKGGKAKEMELTTPVGSVTEMGESSEQRQGPVSLRAYELYEDKRENKKYMNGSKRNRRITIRISKRKFENFPIIC